ncbi:hypothetical protein PAPYR_5059 [Paratrimastix pyriformis]|uniref:Uncharacterized protein n=1 Tax=Paratrimastix pyriformis TaxID=342808 RepID=A0ABQ8UJM4_9EUKA|nr:hypothetical protein PAPYR_5059 [Paratrimastix pyriformis]
MFRALFFIEFDTDIGPVMRAQFPANSVGKERFSLLADELIFSPATDGESPLQLCTLLMGSLVFLFFPILLRDESRYPRGVYRCSLVAAYDKACADRMLAAHKRRLNKVAPAGHRSRYLPRFVDAIYKLASTLLTLETETGALTATSPYAVSLPALRRLPHAAPTTDPLSDFLGSVYSSCLQAEALPPPHHRLMWHACCIPFPAAWPAGYFSLEFVTPSTRPSHGATTTSTKSRGLPPAPSSTPLRGATTTLPALDQIPYILAGPPVPAPAAKCPAALCCPGERDADLPPEARALLTRFDDARLDMATELLWPWIDGATTIGEIFMTLRKLRMMATVKQALRAGITPGIVPQYAPPLVDVVTPGQVQAAVKELVGLGLVGLRAAPQVK